MQKLTVNEKAHACSNRAKNDAKSNCQGKRYERAQNSYFAQRWVERIYDQTCKYVKAR